MASRIFQFVKASIPKLGAQDPDWLVNEQEPQFETSEMGEQGPEMLLLHGLFGALSNWDTTQPLMAQYCKPIALSFPLLKGNRNDVKVKSLALYTEYFIRSRNLAPAILCGNSLGGHVALRIALAAPELVDCLILSGTSGLYEHSVDALPVRPDEKFVREHMDRVFYNKQHITDDAVNQIVDIVVDRKNVRNIINAARSAKKDNLKNLLPTITVPTLLLWGEDDEVTTMSVAEQFHQLMPNSKLVTMKKCGHAPMIEYPEWFSGEVHKFLKEHSRQYKKKPA